MLFLYRPRQTWMPYSLPRNPAQQAAYNRQLQEKFESTRRLPPPVPSPVERDPEADLNQLEELREKGVLTDAEFEAAKAKLQTP
jgi:hypothetical protein